uniref:Uncharacterized protein n=1 Tax=Arundo donax TaxID=35708 RepID=A0A0A9FPP5_ARUDO
MGRPGSGPRRTPWTGRRRRGVQRRRRSWYGCRCG